MRGERILQGFSWRTAVAELTLIVLGVTLALIASAWYDGRRERAEEQLLLSELRSALELDQTDFRSALQRQQQRLATVRQLREAIQSGSASLVGMDFGGIVGWVGVDTNAAPYEALKSRGLSLVSDQRLRLRLVEYYEERFPVLEDTYLNDRDWVRTLAYPYFHEHLRRDLDELGSSTWAPLDVNAVANDPFFWNLTGTKLNRLQTRIIPALEASLAILDTLLVDITGQLAQ